MPEFVGSASAGFPCAEAWLCAFHYCHEVDQGAGVNLFPPVQKKMILNLEAWSFSNLFQDLEVVLVPLPAQHPAQVWGTMAKGEVRECSWAPVAFPTWQALRRQLSPARWVLELALVLAARKGARCCSGKV